jgi:carotenoid cleavage dioxygenase-like enzyme
MGLVQDLPREHGFEPLTVEGVLPRELQGTLFRNGPGLFGMVGERYPHLFDGDGAVSAVRLRDGKAQGACRLVRSEGLVEEQAKGQRRFAAYATLPTGGWHRRVLARNHKNVANTSVMMWRGHLLALMEGGLPTELGSEDLSTKGETTLGGLVRQTFSAHPHYVPARRATYNHGLHFGLRTALDVYELSDDGASRRLTSIPLPGPTMLHDSVVTERHMVFFISPLRLDPVGFLGGWASYEKSLRWRPELGTEVMVVPLDAPARVVRFQAEPFFHFHFANACERGDDIVVDYIRYPDYRVGDYLGNLVKGAVVSEPHGRLHRAVLDLRARNMRTEEQAPHSVEFPQVDPRRTAKEWTHTYVAVHSSAHSATSGVFDALGCFNTKTREMRVIKLGQGQYPSEPLFVPREEASGEDDGWLLTLVYDSTTDRSHLAVLDTQSIDAGPVARAHFDHRLPITFHGVWVPTRPE